jgi:hypothetical protein
VLRKIAVLLVGLIISFDRLQGATDDVGTTAAPFLRINPGARPAGMGEANVAVGGDAYAIYGNPAGLAVLENAGEAIFTYAAWFHNINLGYLGYAQSLKDYGGLGISVIYLDLGDIERRNDIGEEAGFLRASDSALTIAYGVRLVEGLLSGLAIKGLWQRIGTENGYSAAADIGFLYLTPIDGLSLGVGTYNLGLPISIKKDGVKHPLPTESRLGLAYRAIEDRLVLASDVVYYWGEDFKLHAGGEYLLGDGILIRIGYRYGYSDDPLSGLTLGGGIRFHSQPEVSLDYAYVGYGSLGGTHRLSLVVKH